MRRVWASTIFLLLIGSTSSAYGQRFIVIPGGSSGEVDAIHHLGSLPPEVGQGLMEELKCVPQVGFLYRRHFFLMDYKHSGGRFVLYHDKTFWEVPEALWPELLPGQQHLLKVPSWYGYPTGLYIYIGLGALVGLGLIFLCILSMAHVREQQQDQAYRRLEEDERYVTALRQYLEHLPNTSEANTSEGSPGEDSTQENTAAQHRAALAQGIDYLVSQGISQGTARRNLKGFLKVTALARIDDLKAQAMQCAEEQQWEQAREVFQQAAAVAKHHSPNHHKMLLSNIHWCEKEHKHTNPA